MSDALTDFFTWLLADLTDGDSAPARDEDREAANMEHSGRTHGAEEAS